LQTVQETVDTEITARKTNNLRKCNVFIVPKPARYGLATPGSGFVWDWISP